VDFVNDHIGLGPVIDIGPEHFNHFHDYFLDKVLLGSFQTPAFFNYFKSHYIPLFESVTLRLRKYRKPLFHSAHSKNISSISKLVARIEFYYSPIPLFYKHIISFRFFAGVIAPL
jgi:hypothetical protein